MNLFYPQNGSDFFRFYRTICKLKSLLEMLLKQNLKSAKKQLCSSITIDYKPVQSIPSHRAMKQFSSVEGFKPVQIVQIHRGMVAVPVANRLSNTTVMDWSRMFHSGRQKTSHLPRPSQMQRVVNHTVRVCLVMTFIRLGS